MPRSILAIMEYYMLMFDECFKFAVRSKHSGLQSSALYLLGKTRNISKYSNTQHKRKHKNKKDQNITCGIILSVQSPRKSISQLLASSTAKTAMIEPFVIV